MDFDISRNYGAEITDSKCRHKHTHARENRLKETLPRACWPLLAYENSLVGLMLFGIGSELLGLE